MTEGKKKIANDGIFRQKASLYLTRWRNDRVMWLEEVELDLYVMFQALLELYEEVF